MSEDPTIDNSGSNGSLFLQATLVAQTVRRTLSQRANLQLSEDPQLKKVQIIEFMRRMRIWSLEKFEGHTYISVINFYVDAKAKEKNKAVGALILYIAEDYIQYLFKRLGYPEIEQEDQETLKDACGTLCNIIAGLFRSGLEQLGYQDLEMSHFTNYINEVPGGVNYDYKQTEKYEISFMIKGQRQLMVDFTLGEINKNTQGSGI